MPQCESSFVIPFAKLSGITSFAALGQIKRILGTKKVGHTGTLDRFADGLLVVLTGQLTRLVPYITACDKTYRVLFYFGKETDTLDPDGTVIAEKPLPIYRDFLAAVQQLTGIIEQVPPTYSAVKQDGRRLSDKARRGETVAAPPRLVTIYSNTVEKVFYAQGSGAHTEAHLSDAERKVLGAILSVRCSKGTYIRSLVRDIAHRCASAAYVHALRRMAVGPFTLEKAAGFALLKPFESYSTDARISMDKPFDSDTVRMEQRNAPVTGKINEKCSIHSNSAVETVPYAENGYNTKTVYDAVSMPHARTNTEPNPMLTHEDVQCSVVPFREDLAQTLHFQVAALQEDFYSAFITGKPIKQHWFTQEPLVTDGNTIAVFCKGHCAGLIQKNGSGFYYRTVFPKFRCNG